MTTYEYTAFADGTTLGQNVRHFSLYMPPQSTQVVLTITSIRALNLQTGAISGSLQRFDVRKLITAQPTGGTVITPTRLTSAAPPDLSAWSVELRKGATGATEGEIISSHLLNTDEVQAAGLDPNGEVGVNMCPNQIPLVAPLIMGLPDGIIIKQFSTGTAGTILFRVKFALEI